MFKFYKYLTILFKIYKCFHKSKFRKYSFKMWTNKITKISYAYRNVNNALYNLKIAHLHDQFNNISL